jgi:hypothetical protein
MLSGGPLPSPASWEKTRLLLGALRGWKPSGAYAAPGKLFSPTAPKAYLAVCELGLRTKPAPGVVRQEGKQNLGPCGDRLDFCTMHLKKPNLAPMRVPDRGAESQLKLIGLPPNKSLADQALGVMAASFDERCAFPLLNRFFLSGGAPAKRQGSAKRSSTLVTGLLCFGLWFFLATAYAGPPVWGSFAAFLPQKEGKAARPALGEAFSTPAKRPILGWSAAFFALAIAHTFGASAITRLARRVEENHRRKLKLGVGHAVAEESVTARLLYLAGEVEAVFGIWAIPLFWSIVLLEGWSAATTYWSLEVNYTEPLFVVVVMVVASSRPVLSLAEGLLARLAKLGGDTVWSRWFFLVTLGPLLGSFLTEPAAMTICSLLLARTFYVLSPKPSLAYATLGLLFVNVSIGGVLTPYAAPPVLMVAGRWGWDLTYMIAHFGWKSVASIVLSSLLYSMIFAPEFVRLEKLGKSRDPVYPEGSSRAAHPVPAWVTLCHLALLGWIVLTSHEPPLFCGAFLMFLALWEATRHYQGPLSLRRPLLVGFFLAGLAIHGSLQGWWIAPLLEGLGRWPIMITATVLTSFNDNALITFLASQATGLSEPLRQAVLIGAVTGGGLTVIANAPNPAGQALLSRFFPGGVSPLGLAGGALVPTTIAGACFMLL